MFAASPGFPQTVFGKQVVMAGCLLIPNNHLSIYPVSNNWALVDQLRPKRNILRKRLSYSQWYYGKGFGQTDGPHQWQSSDKFLPTAAAVRLAKDCVRRILRKSFWSRTFLGKNTSDCPLYPTKVHASWIGILCIILGILLVVYRVYNILGWFLFWKSWES